MSKQIDTHVLEILASKICHDLISPIGAVNNGVELMEEMGPDAGPEATGLIAYSAHQASAKLQVFRVAYGVGGAACQVTRTGEQWDVTELWRTPGHDVAAHWTTAVAHDGYLYGIYGHRDFAKNPFKCVDIRTGKVHWEKPGFGPSQVIMAGNQLVATTDNGQLVLIEPSPSAYRELARTKAIEGKVWASPALSDRQLLLRTERLVIVAGQYNENRVRPRSQLVIAQLRGGRRDDRAFVQLVMKVTLPWNRFLM